MGDGHEALVSQEVRELLYALDEKSERIVRENLEKLTEHHPGQGQGDKERVTWRGQEVYRLHIGRTCTAFYDVEEDDDSVYVLRVCRSTPTGSTAAWTESKSGKVRIAGHTKTE